MRETHHEVKNNCRLLVNPTKNGLYGPGGTAEYDDSVKFKLQAMEVTTLRNPEGAQQTASSAEASTSEEPAAAVDSAEKGRTHSKFAKKQPHRRQEGRKRRQHRREVYEG